MNAEEEKEIRERNDNWYINPNCDSAVMLNDSVVDGPYKMIVDRRMLIQELDALRRRWAN